MDKIQVTFEFSRAEATAICYFAGVELDDALWERLTKEPLFPDVEKIDKKEGKTLRMYLLGMVIGNL